MAKKKKLIPKLLSSDLVVRTVALVGGFIYKLWLASLQLRYVFHDRAGNPRWSGRPVLYVFWHEMLFFYPHTHGRYKVVTLTSRHRDGELATQILRMVRAGAIRGSTTRGGAAALRKLIRMGQVSHLAIAVDGPKGPRRQVQTGAIWLAGATGMPIVPVGFACDGCWRVRSWDGTVFPYPGAKLRCVTGLPIEIPPDLDHDKLQEYRNAVQQAQDAVQRQAEELAMGGEGQCRLLTPTQAE